MYYHRHNHQFDADVEFVQQSIRRLKEQIAYQRALVLAENSETGFPEQIEMEWFGHDLPVNVLVSPRQPWIDVAPRGDMSNHPPDPIIRDAAQAGFWYNPNLGLFRARVEPQLSESQTVEVYNLANGTALSALFNAENSERQPQTLKHPDGKPIIPNAPLEVADNEEEPSRPTLSTGTDEAPDEASAPNQRRSVRGPSSQAN